MRPFTDAELQKLFDKLPREIKPKKHSAETALPWVALMVLYTGMRLDEIAQLTAADVREEPANGAIVTQTEPHELGVHRYQPRAGLVL